MKIKFILLFTVFLILGLNVANAQKRSQYYEKLDKSKITTNILYDKVVPHSNIEKYNGKSTKEIISTATWKQIYYELDRASLYKENLKSIIDVKNSTEKDLRNKIFNIGILNYKYNKLVDKAIEKGLLKINNKRFRDVEGQNPYKELNVFAASIIKNRKYTSKKMKFKISNDYYFSNINTPVKYFHIDFDNGSSIQKVKLNETIEVKYQSEGTKIIKLTALFEDNTKLNTQFKFEVKESDMPATSITWSNYTADIKYLGVRAIGDVAVFYGDGNTVFTNPVILVDGFDPGNERKIEGLYDIANQQNMLENLKAVSYDGVLVNFHGGADYIQRNAMLIVKLIQDINARMTAAGTMKAANQIVIVGPSMGGLITRYAITYMEENGIAHNVRNWISFDSPQKGANIPLGIQHWLRFYAEVAGVAGAKDGLAKITEVAARQMIKYHYTATSGETAGPNGLNTDFYTELNQKGFPQNCRIVSIINGSGAGNGLDFTAGAKLVDYEFDGWTVDLKGNIWAIPDNTRTLVFEGFYDTVAPLDETSEDIFISNTEPYDGAPGGTTNTMQTLDETDTKGYGDIIARKINHCFIPTISSLALTNTSDPYYVVKDNLASLTTPFDKIYYPEVNEQHVHISAESYTWFYHEIFNYTPQFSSTAVKTIAEDSEYSYTFTATDQNEWNTLTFSIIEKPSWLSLTGSTLSGTPTNDNIGNHNISIKVTDGLKESTQTYSLTVTNTNDAPVFTSQPTQAVMQEIEYSYTMTASDIDPTNDELIFACTSKPSWISFTDLNTISGTPSSGDVGNHNITVTVSDGIAAPVEQTFVLKVKDRNDAPTYTSTEITTATEDSEYSYTIATNDPEGDVVTITFDKKPSWLSYNDVSKKLTGTPLNKDVGSNDVTISITDGIAAPEKQIFTITVTNSNDAPVFTSVSDLTIEEDKLYSYSVTANDIDPTNDNLTFDVSKKPSWLNFDNTTKLLSGTPLNADIGSHEIIITVTDGIVGTPIEQKFTISVTNTNDAPYFTSVSLNTATEDTGYSYDISAKDDDPGSFFIITVSKKPDWLSFDEINDIISGTPQNTNVGKHSIVINVSDGKTITKQEFEITVSNTNDAPIFTSTPNLNINEDSQYSYILAASDIDPTIDNLTFDVTKLPAWLSFDKSTKTLSGTPQNTDVGTHEVIATVSDGIVGTPVEQKYTITVLNVNDAPYFTSTPLETATEDESYSLTISAGDEDTPTSNLIFSVSKKPDWIELDKVNNKISGIPGNSNVGNNSIIIDVTDGESITKQEFIITVENTNDAPTVKTKMEDQSTVFSNTFKYTFDETVFEDIDIEDNLTYKASMTDGSPLPAWLKFDSNTRTFSGTSNSHDSFSIKVTATDKAGKSVSDDFYLKIYLLDIRISPNPVHDITTISFVNQETDYIEIYDGKGKFMLKHNCKNMSSIDLNLANFMPGVYTIKAYVKDQIYQKRIVVVK